MTTVTTLKGTFQLVDAAYAMAIKIGEGAKGGERERIAREAIYSYFVEHVDELATLINIGFLPAQAIGQPMMIPHGVSA